VCASMDSTQCSSMMIGSLLFQFHPVLSGAAQMQLGQNLLNAYKSDSKMLPTYPFYHTSTAASEAAATSTSTDQLPSSVSSANGHNYPFMPPAYGMSGIPSAFGVGNPTGECFAFVTSRKNACGIRVFCCKSKLSSVLGKTQQFLMTRFRNCLRFRFFSDCFKLKRREQPRDMLNFS